MGNISNPSTGVPSPVSGVITFTDGITLGAPSNLGTPSALVGTNVTGTAAGLSIGGNAATATVATNNVPKDVGNVGVGAICRGSAACNANATTASFIPYLSSTGTAAGTAGSNPGGTWRNIGGQNCTAALIGTFQRIA